MRTMQNKALVVLFLLCILTLLAGGAMADSIDSLCPFPENNTSQTLPLHTSTITASVAGQVTNTPATAIMADPPGYVSGSESYSTMSHDSNGSVISGYGSSILGIGTLVQAKQTTVGILGFTTQQAIQLQANPAIVGGGLSASEEYGALIASKNGGNPYSAMAAGGGGGQLSSGVLLSQLNMDPNPGSIDVSYQFASGLPEAPSIGIAYAWSGVNEKLGEISAETVPTQVLNATTGETETVNETIYRQTAFQEKTYHIETEWSGQQNMVFDFGYSASFPAGNITSPFTLSGAPGLSFVCG